MPSWTKTSNPSWIHSLNILTQLFTEACDSDDGDPDVEFEAWKFRELQRLKRDREAREAEEAEQVTFQIQFFSFDTLIWNPLYNGMAEI